MAEYKVSPPAVPSPMGFGSGESQQKKSIHQHNDSRLSLDLELLGTVVGTLGDRLPFFTFFYPCAATWNMKIWLANLLAVVAGRKRRIRRVSAFLCFMLLLGINILIKCRSKQTRLSVPLSAPGINHAKPSGMVKIKSALKNFTDVRQMYRGKVERSYKA